MPTYDPFRSSLFGDAPPATQPQAATAAPIPPLSQEERDSLLSRIGGGALHGLGWLGGSLSKAFGGRAIRGILGGKPHELLSAIPFSDTLGITNPEDEVHGSTLLGGNKDTSFFSPEGIGGFALDVATDPLTYLTFGGGALTKLGKSAEKLSMLPKSIGGVGGRVAGFAPGSAEAAALAQGHSLLTGTATTAADVAGARLGGHVGLHVPFTGLGTTFDLSGPIGAALKVPGVQSAVDAISKVTAPIGRTWNALFSKDAKGFSDEIFQPAAIANSQKGTVAAHGALTEATPIMKLAQEIVGHAPGQVWDEAIHGATSSDLGKKLVTYIEMKPNVGKLTPIQQAAFDAAKADPKIATLGDMMIDQYGKELAANKAAGYADGALEGMGFTHRQSTQRAVNQGGLGKNWSDLSPEEQVSRNKMFEGIYTEGPGGLNQLSTDKNLIGKSKDEAEKIIREQYLGVTQAEEQARKALKTKMAGYSLTDAEEKIAADLMSKQQTGTITAAEQATLDAMKIKKGGASLDPERELLASLDAKWKQAEDLAGWHKKLDHDALDKVGGFFGHHPLAMFEEYKLGQASRRLNAGSAFEVLPQIVETTPTQGSKTLRGVMQEVGLPIDTINSPAHQKMMEGLQAAIDSGKLKLDPSLLDANGKLYTNAFDKLTVGEQNAQRLMGFLNPAKSQAPEAARPVLALYDSMINLIKAGQTSWPATQARNIISDIYKRWTGGGSAFTPLVEAKTLREGGTIKGLAEAIPRFKGMTDAAATEAIRTDMYQLGLLNTKKYQALDAVGTGLETMAKTQPVIGAQPKGLWESAVTQNLPGATSGKTLGEVANPLNVRGVAGAEESKFLPVAMTQSAQNYFEEMNRIATYIDAAKRGYDPLAAMGKVVEAHHDFGNLTNFEKSVMRRVVPFYSWMKQNLPQVVGEIATNPGGRMATTMKAMNDMQSRNAFVPEDVGKTGYAIPTGGVRPDGKQSFITSTGLPMEDLTNLVSLQSLMSQTTPVLRLPYELATGRSVYGANELPTNYPVPAGGSVVNALVQASPFARALSQGRVAWQGASDPVEQGPSALLRLGLGARTVDVNQEQARRQAVEQYVREATAGNPLFRQFNNLYTKPEDRARLTPQEMMLLRLYQDAQQNRLGGR